MTKSDLIEIVAAQLQLPKGKAEQIINCIFDSMEESLKGGQRIEIRGFGSFEIRKYKAYEGRNPRTGDPVGGAAFVACRCSSGLPKTNRLRVW